MDKKKGITLTRSVSQKKCVSQTVTVLSSDFGVSVSVWTVGTGFRFIIRVFVVPVLSKNLSSKCFRHILENFVATQSFLFTKRSHCLLSSLSGGRKNSGKVLTGPFSPFDVFVLQYRTQHLYTITPSHSAHTVCSHIPHLLK